MKTNKMLRISAILLVLTLLSTCVISGTFAKYTTEAKTKDKARVAKWGIELVVKGDNTLYDDTKTGDEVASLAVKANDLAAPGTYQKLATVELSGTPEVKYAIKVVTSLELSNWVLQDGTTEYCPLIFTVDGKTITMDGTVIKTVDELEEAVENAIIASITGLTESEVEGGAYDKVYDAGVAVPESINSVLIDWRWNFDDGNNVNDTVLGNAAKAATIKFDLDVSVTQID